MASGPIVTPINPLLWPIEPLLTTSEPQIDSRGPIVTPSAPQIDSSEAEEERPRRNLDTGSMCKLLDAPRRDVRVAARELEPEFQDSGHHRAPRTNATSMLANWVDRTSDASVMPVLVPSEDSPDRQR